MYVFSGQRIVQFVKGHASESTKRPFFFFFLCLVFPRFFPQKKNYGKRNEGEGELAQQCGPLFS